jgi:hypothetical protein
VYCSKIIHTHYIHSVVVQYFVSGRACCVNQYHYESRQRRVVIRLVHATGKTWCKVVYQHTMYVISLSNISIKTNFKQITKFELRFVHYSEEDYIMCMTSRNFFRSFTNVGLLYFVSHSNVWRHVKVVRQRTSRATSRHSFITTVWWYNILYQTGDFR